MPTNGGGDQPILLPSARSGGNMCAHVSSFFGGTTPAGTDAEAAASSVIAVFLPGINEGGEFNFHARKSFSAIGARFSKAEGPGQAPPLVVGVSVDYPGHGSAEGYPPGELPATESFLADMESLVTDTFVTGVWGRIPQRAQGSCRLFLLGHSMGGVLAMICADRMTASGAVRPDGVVMLSPSVDTLVDSAFESLLPPSMLCCRTPKKTHCCSLLAPAWSWLRTLLSCLVSNGLCHCLLPKEDVSKYPSMTRQRQLITSKTYVCSASLSLGCLVSWK